jgi:xanthine/uracil permease
MNEESTQEKQHWIVYPLGSKPKWPLAILLGIQQYLTMFGATVLIPIIVGGAMKLPPEQLALMISTIFFTSGICTLIQQSALGNRLPVIQGGTFSFLGPTFAIIGMVAAKKLTGAEPMWQIQIQHVAGAIMIASVFEIVLGYTGIMGHVRKLISPIVIGPTIAMIYRRPLDGQQLDHITDHAGCPDSLLPGIFAKIQSLYAFSSPACHRHRLACIAYRYGNRNDLS